MEQQLEVETTLAEGDPKSARAPSLLQRNPRGAFWVFVAAQLVILVALAWNFHGRWFVTDEWDFLANRTVGSLNSLLRPHNEHWSTFPILYFRLLWNLFGIRTYMPYLLSVLGLHIAIGFVLRWIMIRASVMPWIATLSALVFSLYGAGFSDISYPFNIGFDGSVLFGLLFLVGVDHDGPFDRRDALGMASGLAALMCSGIGVPMVVAVALAVWIRRGFRPALMLTLPLGGIYVVWYVAYGHNGVSGYASISALVKFAAFGVAFTFSSLGSSPVVGSLLVLLLIGGVFLCITTTPVAELRRRDAAPFALLIGAVAFMILTGFGRANNALPSSETYAASRYLYIAAAMLIPGIALAASSVVLRWPRSWPVVVLVIALGVPGNIAVMHRENYLHTLDSYRQRFLTIPRLPIAAHLPRSTEPDEAYDFYVTLGWMLDGVRSGRIPPPSSPPTPGDVAHWTTQLAWRQSSQITSNACRVLALPADVKIDPGTRITMAAPVGVSTHYGSGRQAPPVPLVALGRPVTYESIWSFDATITPSTRGQTATLCPPRG